MSDDKKILDALEELNKAHGAHALAEAFHKMQGEVRRIRRREKQSASKLASSIMEGVAMCVKLKADGVPQEEINRGMEALVRGRLAENPRVEIRLPTVQ